MNLLVTGSTGLIGSALVPYLVEKEHSVTRMVRAVPRANEIRWDPVSGALDAADVEGFDAVVHLAGENIAGGRWTAEVKRRIRDSRVQGTRLLATLLARLHQPPKAFICASAIGYYGDRGQEVLREDSPPGRGFLADVCREWEEAARPAAEEGIRLVHLRIGLVLSAAGGALAKMLLPFRLGVGGRIGSGAQYWSWITLDDLVRIIDFSLLDRTWSGPVNAVAPCPVTNLEFTRTLGRVLARPTIFPLPAFAARMALGEMANDLLLASARVEPTKLLASGFEFLNPVLEPALRKVISRR